MSKIEFLAPIPQDVLYEGQVAIVSTGTVYTNTWVLTKGKFFSLEVQFSSDTDVDVKVDLEQSNYLPTVQKSYSPNFVTAIDSLGTVTDENVHIFPVAPVVSVYGRLKLTGQTSNSITTLLTRTNWTEVET